MAASRFDYVAYDFASQKHQEIAKTQCLYLETFINQFEDGRAKALALTALEECYMWIGKAIRDEQLVRNKRAEEALNSEEKTQEVLHGGT